MKLFLLLCTPLLLMAKIHYAKVRPYESIVLKSAVSALVLEVDLSSEGSLVKGKRVIYLDDTLDHANFMSAKQSLKLLEEMHNINVDVAQGLKETFKRQEDYFKRINKLSTVSKTQKDTAFSSFTAAKTQYLGTREKIVTLEKQILDMKYKMKQLEDSILKKSIVLDNKYLYKLMVRQGDFVNPGTALAQIEDISKAKLVLFLEPEELIDFEHKTVYINGEKTAYKVDKVWRVADEKFISSYRAEIYIPTPEGLFSKLLKVELK